MKNISLLFTFLLFLGNVLFAQQKSEPWTQKQLMAPEVLSNMIHQNMADSILIVSVGPDAVIKGSIEMGPASEKANLENLKSYLHAVPRGKEVIIYCGCCPFDKCPNIRPAFKTLKEMGFVNARLLNIPKNIKADWIDKNYPQSDN